MMQATNAKVGWDASRKRWLVQIHIGSEVIKRPLAGLEQNVGEEALRSLAITTAHDEGYELNPAKVSVTK